MDFNHTHSHAIFQLAWESPNTPHISLYSALPAPLYYPRSPVNVSPEHWAIHWNLGHLPVVTWPKKTDCPGSHQSVASQLGGEPSQSVLKFRVAWLCRSYVGSYSRYGFMSAKPVPSPEDSTSQCTSPPSRSPALTFFLHPLHSLLWALVGMIMMSCLGLSIWQSLLILCTLRGRESLF